jgi:hypothetical protein
VYVVARILAAQVPEEVHTQTASEEHVSGVLRIEQSTQPEELQRQPAWLQVDDVVKLGQALHIGET